MSILQLPSKTFLIGEYLALIGGPSLIATTTPLFTAEIKVGKSGEEFHPDSPVARFMAQHIFYHDHHLHFIDPHHGQGGFGASTAAFLAAVLACEPTISNEQLLNLYRQFAATGFVTPSGADLMAQRVGGLVTVSDASAESFSWPFASLGFSLIKTKEKLNTHTHLQTLTRDDLDQFRSPAELAIDALYANNQAQFLTAIHDYKNLLLSANLTATRTQEIINNTLTHPNILAAKGCGAMGADVIAIFYDKENQAEINADVEKRGLIITACDEDLWRE